MRGFGVLPHEYKWFGSFLPVIIHLFAEWTTQFFCMFLSVEIFIVNYLLEVMGKFSVVINCFSFSSIIQLPYGDLCQLKSFSSVYETTSAYNFP